MKIAEHMKILGLKVVDKVTGFKGVATSVSFDLYGCIQVIVTPFTAKDGKQDDSRWFDIARLTPKSKEPVMQLPNYEFGYVADGCKGPAEKPAGKW